MPQHTCNVETSLRLYYMEVSICSALYTTDTSQMAEYTLSEFTDIHLLYGDSFFSYLHLFSDIPSNGNVFSICGGFASDRIGRVYVHSTNLADLVFFHKTLTSRTII